MEPLRPESLDRLRTSSSVEGLSKSFPVRSLLKLPPSAAGRQEGRTAGQPVLYLENRTASPTLTP